MAAILLDITFGTGLFVAFMHVINRLFIAPIYDVAANLTGFICATGASILLGHWIAALLAASAVVCWVALALRTARALNTGRTAQGQAPTSAEPGASA